MLFFYHLLSISSQSTTTGAIVGERKETCLPPPAAAFRVSKELSLPPAVSKSDVTKCVCGYPIGLSFIFILLMTAIYAGCGSFASTASP